MCNLISFFGSPKSPNIPKLTQVVNHKWLCPLLIVSTVIQFSNISCLKKKSRRKSKTYHWTCNSAKHTGISNPTLARCDPVDCLTSYSLIRKPAVLLCKSVLFNYHSKATTAKSSKKVSSPWLGSILQWFSVPALPGEFLMKEILF